MSYLGNFELVFLNYLCLQLNLSEIVAIIDVLIVYFVVTFFLIVNFSILLLFVVKI